MSKNYSKIQASWNRLGCMVNNNVFWSSTEYSQYHAWSVAPSVGTIGFTSRNYVFSISCFLKIG